MNQNIQHPAVQLSPINGCNIIYPTASSNPSQFWDALVSQFPPTQYLPEHKDAELAAKREEMLQHYHTGPRSIK